MHRMFNYSTSFNFADGASCASAIYDDGGMRRDARALQRTAWASAAELVNLAERTSPDQLHMLTGRRDRPLAARVAQTLNGRSSRSTGRPASGDRSPHKTVKSKARHEAYSRRARTAPRLGAPRRRPQAHRRAARARQAHGARAHRAAARSRLVRRIRHVRAASLHRFRHGPGREDPRRRRRHRLGHGQRPRGLRLRQGFHRLRRLAVRDPCAEDHQAAGHGAEEPRADHRPLRRRRRAHPGRRRGARRLWRGVPAQCAGLRRHSADFGDHGPLRRRRRLFAGDDRLHLHGARHELHVRHRPGRREDRHQRDRDGRRARRRLGPHDQELDRRPRLRQ